MVPTTHRKAVSGARKRLAPASGAKLLRRAIDLSQLPDRRFATEVLVVNERSVRRWLYREYPLPRVVQDKLRSYIAERERQARHPTPE